MGRSDLAEIAALCAIEHGVEIVAVVQAAAPQDRFVGLPVFEDFDAVPKVFDAVMITDTKDVRAAHETALARFGGDRVLVPALLRIGMRRSNEATVS
jgi:hypothetical protein